MFWKQNNAVVKKEQGVSEVGSQLGIHLVLIDKYVKALRQNAYCVSYLSNTTSSV